MQPKPIHNNRWQHVGFIFMFSLVTAVALLLILYANASAKLWASGAGNCGAFNTAIQLAEDGDVIVQMIPAKDTEDSIITKDLRISGGWLPTENCEDNNQDFTETVDYLIYGFTYNAPFSRSVLNNGGSVLTLEDPSASGYPNLDQLVIEHIELHSTGTPVNGGGINGTLAGGADVLLDNVFFDDNYARDYGGGINLELRGGSILRIEDSLFDQNEADDFNGGGLYVELRENSQLLITKSVFVNNQANNGAGFEVHLYDDSRLTIVDSVFDNNSTYVTSNSAAGGFIHLHGSGNVRIANTTFVNNDTSQNGAGLYVVMEGGEVDVTKSTFDNNTADNGSNNSSKGGGLYVEMNGGILNINSSRFVNNTADQSGGGLYVKGVGSVPAEVLLANTSFAGNFPNDYWFEESGSGPLNYTVLNMNNYQPLTSYEYDPNFEWAEILSITLDANFDYQVAFETYNFEPDTSDVHVHFFFDTVAPADAGVPGSGPWILYGGPSPFTQYNFANRPFGPDGAEKMCILVANPDHSVRLNTGNCVKLP